MPLNHKRTQNNSSTPYVPLFFYSGLPRLSALPRGWLSKRAAAGLTSLFKKGQQQIEVWRPLTRLKQASKVS